MRLQKVKWLLVFFSYTFCAAPRAEFQIKKDSEDLWQIFSGDRVIAPLEVQSPAPRIVSEVLLFKSKSEELWTLDYDSGVMGTSFFIEVTHRALIRKTYPLDFDLLLDAPIRLVRSFKLDVPEVHTRTWTWDKKILKLKLGAWEDEATINYLYTKGALAEIK